nr:uncharacterized protein CTRU02_03099 [Colletotrichum truncatum]KAF6798057.1 hypothetical protein CTRU02_03099 [Colletotrichum truncatum]
MTPTWTYECPVHIETLVSGAESIRFRAEQPQLPLHTMQQVHDVLVNCSSLKSLKLRVTFLGCTDQPDRYNFPFEFPRGSHYPSKLEILHLDGYDFEDREWMKVQPPKASSFYSLIMPRWITEFHDWYRSNRATKYYEWKELPDHQKHKSNLDLWIEAMDFSHIQELGLRTIRGAGLVTIRLPPLLKSLKSLVIRGHWARDFILALPGNTLKDLSWVSSCNCESQSVIDVIRHHGQSLKSLERRQPETSYERRKVFTPEQLITLSNIAPNLETLSIDLNRDGAWPVQELKTIAQNFPNLTHLKLYLELESEARRQRESFKWSEGWMGLSLDDPPYIDNMARPLLDKESAMKIFKLLSDEKIGKEFNEVNFFAGDWERKSDIGMYEADWLEYRNSWATCKVSMENFQGGAQKSVTCEGKDTKVIASDNSWMYEPSHVTAPHQDGLEDAEIEEELRRLQEEMAM